MSVQYAVLEDKAGYLSTAFILELACKKLDVSPEEIEAKVGTYTRGKRKGQIRGELHWTKCITGGYKKDLGVMRQGTTYGYYITDCNGNVLFGSNKEEHNLSDLAHERWLKNPSAQRHHKEYLDDVKVEKQKQIEDKQRLLDTAYSLNQRYGTEFKDCVTWDEIYSFLDTMTFEVKEFDQPQVVKEVKAMSKSTIWNSLKTLGYTSEQLKADYNKTYQSANESLLQSILNKLQPTVVDEVVVINDAVQSHTEVTEPTITEQANVPEVVYDVSEVITEANQTAYEVINQPIVTMPVEVTTETKVLDDPWLTTEVTKPVTPVQSSTTVSTTNKVEIPEQIIQPSTVVTEDTDTTNEVEMNNSYSFSFQETKLPITVLEISNIKGNKIEVVNLTDAYFIELRDNKLYVSFGLHIKTFKASNYRIVKAFNSLLNGSNFIKLRDLRENNRDILVNLGRVKTIERNDKFIKFHWSGWLTYPGYHDLHDWKVID